MRRPVVRMAAVLKVVKRWKVGVVKAEAKTKRNE
jgi:hypothetical protein